MPTIVAGVGAALILSHVLLGPTVVPVAGAIAGLVLALAAGVYVLVTRSSKDTTNR